MIRLYLKGEKREYHKKREKRMGGEKTFTPSLSPTYQRNWGEGEGESNRKKEKNGEEKKIGKKFLTINGFTL